MMAKPKLTENILEEIDENMSSINEEQDDEEEK